MVRHSILFQVFFSFSVYWHSPIIRIKRSEKNTNNNQIIIYKSNKHCTKSLSKNMRTKHMNAREVAFEVVTINRFMITIIIMISFEVKRPINAQWATNDVSQFRYTTHFLCAIAVNDTDGPIYGWQSTQSQLIQCNPLDVNEIFSIFTAVIVWLLRFIDNCIRFNQWMQCCTTFN